MLIALPININEEQMHKNSKIRMEKPEAIDRRNIKYEAKKTL
jgi:hypothetical protein